ncbi:MAG: hypothetical protein P1U53_15175, partial [Sulfitobacter sp.]|nr:hypothetical protein [Sulfitobacter sp.]
HCLSTHTKSGGGWNNPGDDALITRHIRRYNGNPPTMLVTLAKLEDDILELADDATSIGREDDFPSDAQRDTAELLEPALLATRNLFRICLGDKKLNVTTEMFNLRSSLAAF